MSKKALMIIGMHRSGTSAMTRILNLCGAALPTGLLSPAPDNELGFWESRHINRLNDDALAELGSFWQDITFIQSAAFQRLDVQPLILRAREILDPLFAENDLVAIKDPRISRLVPLWKEIMNQMGVEPIFVLMFRHPMEVAASLGKREGFPEYLSHLLWLNYMLLAERDTRGAQRMLVGYDCLLQHWNRVLQGMQDAFSLPWSGSMSEIRGEVEAFLSPRLRHTAYDQESLQNLSDKTGLLQPVYAELRRQEGTGCKENWSAFDQWRERADWMAGMAAPILGFWFETDTKYRQARVDILDLQGQLELKRQELQTCEYRKEICEQEKKKCEETKADIQEALDAVLCSRSWRITAPLRRVSWHVVHIRKGMADKL